MTPAFVAAMFVCGLFNARTCRRNARAEGGGDLAVCSGLATVFCWAVAAWQVARATA